MKLANAVKRCFKRENSGWATEKDIRSLLKTPENGGVVIGGHAGKPLFTAVITMWWPWVVPDPGKP